MKLSLSLCFLLMFAAVSIRAADLAQTNAPVSTETNVEASVPERVFTNSVKMVLLKMPVGDFWAGKYEVTQPEYRKVMGVNPSAFSGDEQPVDSVSWNDAMDFCQKLTDMDIKKKKIPEGYRYTLPTEAEWISLVGDATVDNAVSSVRGTPRTSSSPVGSMLPNGFGLYDIRGNLMEFCLAADPRQPNSRFLKGGSWADFSDVNLRPEFRWYTTPDERKNTFGFRVLLKAK